MKRAMARQAEAEREKRAKSLPPKVNRWLPPSLATVGHDDGAPARPATAEFANAGRARSGEEHHSGGVPAPMISAIGEISSFLIRETAAAQGITPGITPRRPNHRPCR